MHRGTLPFPRFTEMFLLVLNAAPLPFGACTHSTHTSSMLGMGHTAWSGCSGM